MNTREAWLHIDERVDVVTSVAACTIFLTKVDEQPAFWKHVVVNLHSALQGAIVCHLSGTAQLGALDKKSFDMTMEWHEKDRSGQIDCRMVKQDGLLVRQIKSSKDQFPIQRLADAKTLFERLYKQSERLEGAGDIISVSLSQKRAFKRLHSLRNDFAHFTPKGWSIELTGLPHICIEMLSVISAIVKGDWAFRHLEGDQHAELNDQIKLMAQMLDRLADPKPTM